jgi:hypothetical protein
MDRPPPEPSLNERRERTIRLLCDHYAQDRLEMEEFEARLDSAHRARGPEELQALLHDLPEPRSLQARERPPAGRAESGRETAEALVRRGGAAVKEAVRDTRTMVAIMGGVERHGHWTPARKNLVIAMMGGAELDFREVDLPAGVTEVVVLAMMGGVEVIVPPELAVDANGIAIMGGFAHSSPRRAEPDVPVLRVTGLCVMGGVEVKVRHPGETAKQAQKRLAAEARAGRSRRLTEGE